MTDVMLDAMIQMLYETAMSDEQPRHQFYEGGQSSFK